MTSTLHVFDAQHEDMVHDAQFDYYSKRLATCSSDRTVRIFAVEADNQQKHVADLAGHEGPVWQVAWAHPKFGTLLASCSYDRRVIIWKETSAGVWQKIFTHQDHAASVNSVAWAPHEYGLVLACASSDASLTILTHKDDNSWDCARIADAHQIGANSVSWAPALGPVPLTTAPPAEGTAAAPARLLVSGGCDNKVRIWECNSQGQWGKREKECLEGHNDWVRAVAFAPSAGTPSFQIASGAQDGSVIVWTYDADANKWDPRELPKFSSAVYGVSWSPMGNILAVACGDNTVSLWKESLDGAWQTITNVTDAVQGN